MNKLEIDVLSKNNPGNKYIEVISNYRLASDNFQQKIEILESRLDSLHSEVLGSLPRNLSSNSSIRRHPMN